MTDVVPAPADEVWAPYTLKVGQRVRIRQRPECLACQHTMRLEPAAVVAGYQGNTGRIVDDAHPRWPGHPYSVRLDRPVYDAEGRRYDGGYFALPELTPIEDAP